jgi:3',5'-cyclic AMP phosphodiesterase CpdA
MAFVLLHVSDLHVSSFGDTFHDRAHLVRRSRQPLDLRQGGGRGGGSRYETVWEQTGWRIARDLRARRPHFVLVDPEGYAHPVPGPRNGAGSADPVERAVRRAQLLEARRADVLARALPGLTAPALQALLAETPENTNLRLLHALRRIGETDGDADLVLITGDLTDNGAGYGLVEAAFARWLARGRLLAVPGNHDLYLFPIAGSERPAPSHASKRTAWRAFAGRLGLPLDESGGFALPLPEADAIIVGLDSCLPRQPRFYRHNGAIGAAQLAYLRRIAATPAWREARHRIVALHHHVVPLPHGVGRRAPSEIGMRLDDAKAVAMVLNEIGATYVLHGHRHVSEERHPAGCNFRLLASPSLTLGCKSGDRPSYWRVELDRRAHVTRVRIPVEAVEQQDDPGSGPESGIEAGA